MGVGGGTVHSERSLIEEEILNEFKWGVAIEFLKKQYKEESKPQENQDYDMMIGSKKTPEEQRRYIRETMAK